MTPPFPHEEIRRTGDRGWTLRLLAELPAADDEARREIVCTLRFLEDPRAVGPLTAWLLDRSAPPALRECASHLLTGDYEPPPGDLIRAWWAGDDAVLRRHALGCMEADEADIVEAVASDPAHPLQETALRAMTFGFEEPRHHAIVIGALSHPDARIRQAAADVLVMAEPAAAELPLLRCAAESDPGVACAAMETLWYYPTRRVVRALAVTRDHGDRDPEIRSAAAEALREIAGAVSSRSGPADDPRHVAMLAWVAPVRQLLGLTDADLAYEPGEPTPRAPVEAAPEPEIVLAALDDPDFPLGALRDLLGREVAAATDPGRVDLGPRLHHHADPIVRCHGVRRAAAAGDRDAVVAALNDPSTQVQAAAGYHLATLPADPEIARILWSRLPQETGIRAWETLESWLHHAPPDEVPMRLVTLVRSDPRDGVCRIAVEELARRCATDAIEALLPLLREPPRVTWALHIALLDAAAALGLRVATDDLDGIDHLDVQRALGPHHGAPRAPTS